MNYRMIVCLMFQLCILTMSYGQKTRSFHLDVDYNTFHLSEAGNGAYLISSDRHDVVFKTDSLQPALPYIPVSVLLAPNESLISYSVLYEDSIVKQPIVIMPNPQLIPTDMVAIDDRNDMNVSYTEKVYPDSILEYTGTQIADGYKTVTFLITPFCYDASSKCLSFKRNINLGLNTDSSISQSVGRIGMNMREYISGKVINAEELEEQYPLESPAQFSRSTSSVPYEYLIVTNNVLKSAFEELTKWKTRKGVRSKVITVEEISSYYTGADLQEKIKRALLDYYDGTYNGLTYVLLGGDVNIVPARMCYVKCNGRVDSTPADIYYACFDKDIIWDGNGNGIFGEIEDSIDLEPEIYVTRIPVQTLSDANAFVNRVIAYERNPKKDFWHNNILMGGCKIFSNFLVDGDSISDAQYKSEKSYNYAIAPYWNGTRVRFYDTATDFPGGANYQYSAVNLMDQLSKGYNFVNIASHGNSNAWSMETGGSFFTSSASSLRNEGYTFISTIACETNSFDKSLTCLSEAFMRNSHGGILGYVGCSRRGWAYSDQQNGPSEVVNEDVYNLLFSTSNANFGRVVQNAKVTSCSFDLGHYGAFRWLMLGINPLGDPELPIYTMNPKRFGDINVSISNGSIRLDSKTSGCRFCVTDLTDSDFYMVQKGSGVAMRNDRDSYLICVTKFGYIPCTVRTGYKLYIQNQTIEGDVRFFSTNVEMGSNVTNQTLTLPVRITDGGRLIVSKKGEAILDKGFSVEKGGTLEIKKW